MAKDHRPLRRGLPIDTDTSMLPIDQFWHRLARACAAGSSRAVGVCSGGVAAGGPHARAPLDHLAPAACAGREREPLGIGTATPRTRSADGISAPRTARLHCTDTTHV
jgi:hypothetical protein